MHTMPDQYFPSSRDVGLLSFDTCHTYNITPTHGNYFPKWNEKQLVHKGHPVSFWLAQHKISSIFSRHCVCRLLFQLVWWEMATDDLKPTWTEVTHICFLALTFWISICDNHTFANGAITESCVNVYWIYDFHATIYTVRCGASLEKEIFLENWEIFS